VGGSPGGGGIYEALRGGERRRTTEKVNKRHIDPAGQ